MKVILAGYNLDADVINELKAAQPEREDVTPETLSASYARISRDPRPIDEIRRDARVEVERTRRSNKAIIFKMGHHSVAEHAVFNFDIIGASRLAMEEVEHFRLCSYTEKSQRYITLEDDFVIPEEIQSSPHKSDFIAIIQKQNAFYHKAFAALKDYVFEKYPELAADPKNHSLLEGWAKEDARYITPLATEAQVGQTINARNLELLFRRFASSPLSEVRALGREMFARVKDVAPSIILFTEANDYDQKTHAELTRYIQDTFTSYPTDAGGKTGERKNSVTLLQHTPGGDDVVLAALLQQGNIPGLAASRVILSLGQTEKTALMKEALKYMEFFDSAPRAFELAHLQYEVIISAACFGQLKRHRMATIIPQSYDPDLGVTVPVSITETGLENEFTGVINETNTAYGRIARQLPQAAPYVLTNAHRRRVLVGVNLRELYHIARLREDHHAQWDIRDLSQKMTALAKEIMPVSCMLLCGKDSYAERYQEMFGALPKCAEIPQPGGASG
ncbi:MAG: FAD-dependent thymidylate synthase [Candidatus Omnitrophica bacterium]|nr:FAD-dependent thymidylate synthase [Candidatus Omnitrophota bacterium]